MVETAETMRQVKHNQTSLDELADMIDYLVHLELKSDPYGIQQTILDMEWAEAILGVEELLRQREHGIMTDQQRQQLKGLLVKLEEVKPITERLNLAWYRNPPPERKPVVK